MKPRSAPDAPRGEGALGGSREGAPWPDIAHTYDVAAEHYAATFAAELDGKPFDRNLLDRYAAEAAGRGEVWDVGCGAAGHLTRYLADRGVAASGADISPGSVAVARGQGAATSEPRGKVKTRKGEKALTGEGRVALG